MTTRLRRSSILSLLFALVSLSALANNWDKPTGLNSTINFDLCDLNQGNHDAWHGNNSHDIAPTDISPTHAHTCNTVEVRVNDSAYGEAEPPGWWECHSGIATVCYSGHVHLNTTKTNGYTAAQKMSLICQEIGHSVGLKHPTSGNSCMVQAISVDRQHLIQHDIDILNAEY